MVVAEIFPVTASQDRSNYLISGTFFCIYGPPGGHPPFIFKQHQFSTEKNIYQKFGGPCPPWLRHCVPLHFWQTCSFRHQLDFSGKHSSHFARRLNHSHFHHCLARYSFIQLGERGTGVARIFFGGGATPPSHALVAHMFETVAGSWDL